MIPIKYIIGGVALFGVAFGAFTVVRHYNETVEENALLEVELSMAQTQIRSLEDVYKNVTAAQTTNDTNTRTIIERTQSIQEKIRDVPVTTKCVESPAIGVLLDDYNGRLRGQTKPNDGSEATPTE